MLIQSPSKNNYGGWNNLNRFVCEMPVLQMAGVSSLTSRFHFQNRFRVNQKTNKKLMKISQSAMPMPLTEQTMFRLFVFCKLLSVTLMLFKLHNKSACVRSFILSVCVRESIMCVCMYVWGNLFEREGVLVSARVLAYMCVNLCERECVCVCLKWDRDILLCEAAVSIKGVTKSYWKGDRETEDVSYHLRERKREKE